MALAQLSLELTQHNNHYLFSDHYLDEILKRSPIWRESLDEALAFSDWLKMLYAKEKDQLPHYKETQLEEHWFDPILEKLGHTFETQASIPSLRRTGMKYPDYIFFPDEAVRQAAVSAQSTEEYTGGSLAVGEMKKWGTPLSKKIQGGTPSFENNNPSFQIDYYLRATNLDWGILTNGNRWRLVHKDTSYKLDVYFEIDLEIALVKEWKAAIVYFYLFFRQIAFKPDGEDRIFLEGALRDSRAYAVQLETDLRDNAYKALEQLITGFFESHQNNIKPQNPDDLKLVYDNSLYLLYRILFLFYGENRGLLPMHNDNYRIYSLTSLAKKIATQIDTSVDIPPMMNLHWTYLQNLFRIISGEDPNLNAYLEVPRYNGGLFNPRLHPFLESHFVGDRFLARAIDYLSRRTVTEGNRFAGRERVDYRTLGVRQLGSIYEGLLEYQPRQATEPIVAVRKGKVEHWIPETEKKHREKVLERRQRGEMYLATDKGERKASGSYYTPDYIVKYIVENTLGPLVDTAREKIKARGQTLHGQAATDNAQMIIDEILALNILDPAMGSGHFLVEATDHLARALVSDPWVTIRKETQDEDLVYWRRQVVEHCIYGVDKNLLAVELAKLSLWLVTASKDKPLSFIDHHLRHGDSLVGTRLNDLNFLPTGKKTENLDQQIDLFNESAFTRDAGLAVGGMLTIQSLPSDGIEDIRAKEETLTHLRETHLDKWRAIADLWVSVFFGNEMTPAEYAALARHLQGTTPLLENITRQHLSHPALAPNDYFHWELEFPEIYFDRHGRPKKERGGFDAVIGNPPYVRQEVITPYKPFLKQQYVSYHGSADLYLYFYEQGINLLREKARISYITSGTFARSNFAKAFRKWLPNNSYLESIIDFGENQPFEGAEMARPTIMILQRASNSLNFRSLIIEDTQIPPSLSEALNKDSFICDTADLDQDEWTFKPRAYRNLLAKILDKGTPLEQIANGHIYDGVKTGFNEAFIVDKETRNILLEYDPSNSEIIYQILSGSNLRPWYKTFDEDYLIFSYRGIEIDAYPTIKNHLQQYHERLEPRPPDWTKPKWKGRKAGSYKWYELQDAIAFFDEFNQNKILWCEITKLPRFVWDETGKCINNSGFFISRAQPEWLGILQSRTIWFVISQICQPFRLRAGLWQYKLYSQYVKRLPIPIMMEADKSKLGDIAMEITDLAHSRYVLHQQTRHRILTDLGTSDGKLNQKLTAWWALDFSAYRAEVKKAFKREIPLMERDDWEAYLEDRKTQHNQLTNEIIRLETELNTKVYRLFKLNDEEIRIIEESTKYKFGEV